MTKIFYNMIDFCESNQNFITEHVKLLTFKVFPGFFDEFC